MAAISCFCTDFDPCLLLLLAKLDLAQQVDRITAIEEIENEGFAPKSFKTSRAPKPEDIPLPPMELKSINVANLKNEILCHPSVRFVKYWKLFNFQINE